MRFARVTEEDRACARRERSQNRAGGFQHGMPAARVEHDARVEIAAVVDERWTVAAKKACAGASPRRHSSVRIALLLAPRHRSRVRPCQRAANDIVRDKRGRFGRAGQLRKLFFVLKGRFCAGWTNQAIEIIACWHISRAHHLAASAGTFTNYIANAVSARSRRRGAAQSAWNILTRQALLCFRRQPCE